MFNSTDSYEPFPEPEFNTSFRWEYMCRLFDAEAARMNKEFIDDNIDRILACIALDEFKRNDSFFRNLEG